MIRKYSLPNIFLDNASAVCSQKSIV